MNTICCATKANGERCKGTAIGQHGYCWHHAPENAAKRQEIATRGGQGKAARRTAILWDEVRAVIEGVESKRLTPSQGNSMLRGYGTLIELGKLYIEQAELEINQRRLELDVEERTDLKERMAALEAHAERRQGLWGV